MDKRQEHNNTQILIMGRTTRSKINKENRGLEQHYRQILESITNSRRLKSYKSFLITIE